mgnify:CR=1 FL=1
MLQKINGVELFVESYGQGEPVILVHGLTADHHSMENIGEWLKDDYQVILYDCRGHGQSEKPAHYTLMDHAQDLLGIMDFYGLTQANVIGESMGTYISQQAAILAPERFRKLILLVPKAHGKTSSVQRLLEEAGKSLNEVSQEEMMAIIGKATYAPTTPKEMILQAMEKMAGGVELTPKQKAAVDEALAGFDLRPNLGKITCPTLVCSGKYDGLNPPDMGREVADLIPNARFELFEHSGHLLVVEEEEKCKQLVRNFLQEAK